MKTIVKKEDIFKFLESLRKLGANCYVLQWGSNTNSDFLIKYYKTKHSHTSFDIQVESMDARSSREIVELKAESISNKKFRDEYKFNI